MKAVVMAGGEGSRLRPITANRPKPLTPICNRPIMEHILGLLRRHGIDECIATLHYLSDEIQSYFGDGSEFGMPMRYSIEETPLGTAGSVKQAEAQLRDESFLIVSGDALTDCDLTAAIEFHRSKGAVATLILSRVENPLEFGVVITEENGAIVRFLEKPGWSEVFSDTVNTGMYILEPEVFDLMEAGQNYDWSRDIFPELLRLGKPVFGYVMDGYWADIGSLTQYREAQHHMLSRTIDLPIDADEIRPGVFAGENCIIDDRATIVPPVCFGRNCKIKADTRIGPYTVIGDHALIEEGACVERSVLWDSTYVGPNAGIQSAIVCSRVTIKRETVVMEDAVIGDRCLLDVGCTIRPRVKLWPDKILERGSTLTMSLIWGNRWRGQLFRDLGVAGLSNIEFTPDFACRLGAAFGSCFPNRAKIVTSRDSTRSSRMIKRSLTAALIGVGCDVIDMRSSPVPVARHYMKVCGAAGAIHVRKLPGNSRVTLCELFDQSGAYLSRDVERKVETIFFREDFARIDPDDLGVIEYATRALEGYEGDFFRFLPKPESNKPFKVVCDYGYSALASIYPAMLGNLGIESISLNGFNDAKQSPRTTREIDSHLEKLAQIVGTLGYDLGVLFTDEGERLTLVSSSGDIVQGQKLLAVFAGLFAKVHPGARIALTVTAPDSYCTYLESLGASVVRTKSDTRSLVASAVESEADLAGDDRGGFMFRKLHLGFDAMFAFAQLVGMLRTTGLSLADAIGTVPDANLSYTQVPCPWEAKGVVMRQLTEENRTGKVETLDGIKIYENNDWSLVLPDALEPMFHIYVESTVPNRGAELLETYRQKVEKIIAQTR